MQGFRKAAGLIAALIVAGIGGVLIPGSPAVGFALLLVGLFAAVVQGVALWRTREDPYDLKKLWEYDGPSDKPAEPIEDDDPERNDYAYCHRCGHAVPESYARCPECGEALR